MLPVSVTPSYPYGDNSGDDSSYNLNLTGAGSAAAVPAIYVETGGGYYASGGYYDFGIVTQGGSSAPITFTVRTRCDAVLNLVPVPWSDNSVFSVSAPGTGSIAGNSHHYVHCNLFADRRGPGFGSAHDQFQRPGCGQFT